MTSSASYQATLATAPNTSGVPAQTVVALPPSDLDTSGLMRIYVNGVLITRSYDQTMEQP